MNSTTQTDQATQNLVEIPFLLLTGGILYWAIEICYRGHSHWTMALCGALCFFGIYKINERLLAIPFLLRALLGAGLIICVEFFAGCLLNLWLGMQIWDYSAQPLHLLGQICLPFFVLWFLLCIPAGLLCRFIRRVVFLKYE